MQYNRGGAKDQQMSSRHSTRYVASIQLLMCLLTCRAFD